MRQDAKRVSSRTALLLAAYIASIPLFAFDQKLFLISWLAAWMLAISTLLDSKGRIALPQSSWLIGVWIIWTTAALMVNGKDVAIGIRNLVSVLLNFGMMLMVAHVLSNVRQQVLNRVLGLFVAAATMVALGAIHDLIVVGSINAVRIDAGYYNSNHMGFMCAMAATVAIYIMHVNKNVAVRTAVAGSLVLLVIGVLLSGSRQGLVIMLIGTSMASVVVARWYAATLVIVGGIALLVATQIEWSQLLIGRRILRFLALLEGSVDADQSAGARLLLVKTGLSVFGEHPIVGVGWNNFRAFAVSHGYTHETYSHNNYVEIAVSSGLVGFAMYYTFVMHNLTAVWKKCWSDPFARLTCIMLLCVLVGDLVRVSYYQRLEVTIFAFALAAQGRLRYLRRCPSATSIQH